MGATPISELTLVLAVVGGVGGAIILLLAVVILLMCCFAICGRKKSGRYDVQVRGGGAGGGAHARELRIHSHSPWTYAELPPCISNHCHYHLHILQSIERGGETYSNSRDFHSYRQQPQPQQKHAVGIQHGTPVLQAGGEQQDPRVTIVNGWMEGGSHDRPGSRELQVDIMSCLC